MRLRLRSTSSTLTFTMSPGFTISRGSFTKRSAKRGDVHEAVLVDADVDEGAEVGDVGHDALEHHAGLRSLISSTPSLKVAVLNSGRGSRPGFSSSFRMSVTVGTPNLSSANCSRLEAAQRRSRRRSAARISDFRSRQDAAHHRVALRVHGRGVQRVVAVRGSAGSRRTARRPWGPAAAPSADPGASGTGRSGRGARRCSARARHRGPTPAPAALAEAVLTSTPTAFTQSSTTASSVSRQLGLVDVVLVLADADRLRVDLDQLRQRVLQAPRDRDRAAHRHVERRATPCDANSEAE